MRTSVLHRKNIFSVFLQCPQPTSQFLIQMYGKLTVSGIKNFFFKEEIYRY